MDWWGWVTWGVTAAIALGGLVLGIRAERRASRYRPDWTISDGKPAKLYNRTGEDARRVTVELQNGELFNGGSAFSLVLPNEYVRVYAKPVVGFESYGIVIRWTRPSTGKSYVYPRQRSRLRKALQWRGRGTSE